MIPAGRRRPLFTYQWAKRKRRCEDGTRSLRFGCPGEVVAWLGSPRRASLVPLCARHVWSRLHVAERYGYAGGHGLGKASELWVGDGDEPSGDLLASEDELTMFAFAHPKPPPRQPAQGRLL